MTGPCFDASTLLSCFPSAVGEVVAVTVAEGAGVGDDEGECA